MKLSKSDKYFIIFFILLLCVGVWWWIFNWYQRYDGKVYYNEHKNEIDFAVETYENAYKEYYNTI